MTGLLDSLPQRARGQLRETAQPIWAAPMVATLTTDRFSDPGWIFERKLHGERCLAFRAGRLVRLTSRNRIELNGHYPELAAAPAVQGPDDFVVDGEDGAFAGSRTSFAKLQNRRQVRDPEAARRTSVLVFLYLFDPVHLDGHDLTALQRRRVTREGA